MGLVNIAREREGAKRRSNQEGHKEIDLETQISIIRIYQLLLVCDYFLYFPAISTHPMYISPCIKLDLFYEVPLVIRKRFRNRPPV